jgi:hypothetical protein
MKADLLGTAIKARDIARERRAARREHGVTFSDSRDAYLGLTSLSTQFTHVTRAGGTTHVNLLLPELRTSAVFAGIRTAVQTAGIVASSTDLPLRVLAAGTARGTQRRDALRLAAQLSGLPESRIDVRTNEELASVATTADDVWIVTHWTTAHAIQVACENGVLEPRRVIYLIQDYEADFVPASTDRALARWTYHAGFTPLVNSIPVAQRLRQAESVHIPAEAVFAPAIDLERTAEVAAARERSDSVRVLFYGRPSKPRNMFGLGVAALRLHAAGPAGLTGSTRFASAGERHRRIPLSPHASLTSLGRLGWSEYYDVLSRTDVLISLQASVHPSHPPLEAAVSGAVVVTNDVESTRAQLHDRLLATEANPISLARAIDAATDIARSSTGRGFEPIREGALGVPLRTSVSNVLASARA